MSVLALTETASEGETGKHAEDYCLALRARAGCDGGGICASEFEAYRVRKACAVDTCLTSGGGRAASAFYLSSWLRVQQR